MPNAHMAERVDDALPRQDAVGRHQLFERFPSHAHRNSAMTRGMVAATTANATDVTTPMRIMRRMSMSPPAQAVAEVAPAHGNAMPTATFAMRIAIEAGLYPIWTAAGMKMLQYSVAAATPDTRLVVMTVIAAAR